MSIKSIKSKNQQRSHSPTPVDVFTKVSSFLNNKSSFSNSPIFKFSNYLSPLLTRKASISGSLPLNFT
jgi:hypothetical protein